MKKYPKIQTVFKRDHDTNKLLLGKYSKPEFYYLKDNVWTFTEKVDGTNIRIQWFPDTQQISYLGRTNKAEIPKFLFERLIEIFNKQLFMDMDFDCPVCLYGEGYGNKIQKAGKNYIADGTSFVLFDININGYWLDRKNVIDTAKLMGIEYVPIVGYGNISDMINIVEGGIYSIWGDFLAEGIVARPTVELCNKKGERVITKLKHKDFERSK